MNHLSSRRGLWLLVGALLCAAGTWIYASHLLIPYQIREDAAHGRPRGNLSDLYPRWLGSKELLLHGRDPYTLEMTREIQTGFYGRPLDRDQAGNQYQQGFYYPAYVAFFLAPTIYVPFHDLDKGFFWILVMLTVVNVFMWLRMLHWSVPPLELASLIVLILGSLPLMEGLKLQQISLFVLPLLAIAMVLLASDRQIPAGILLAVTTIKPQLVWPILLWLVIWSVADWRRRYRWAASFLLSMVILCVAAEFYLPHWIFRFCLALREYHGYTGEMSVMDLLIGMPWSRALELLALAMMTFSCWRERRHAADTETFTFMLCLVLATTVLLTPTYGLYNQAALIPALVFMVKERQTIWQRNLPNRLLCVITVGLVGWPWISAAVLASLSFVLPAVTVQRGWAVPYWPVLVIPVEVTGAMLVFAGQRIFAASGESTSS